METKMGVDSYWSRREPDSTWESIKTFAAHGSEKHNYDWLGKSLGGLTELDIEASECIIKLEKNIWKDEETRNLVDQYFDNSLATSEFFCLLRSYFVKPRSKLCGIGVALQDITPTTSLSDAEYVEIKKDLMDYKNHGRFKDFEHEFEAVLRGHELLQDELKKKILAFKEEKSEHKAEEKSKHKAEEELKDEPRLWRTIFTATAAAVGVLSVVAAVLLPPLPLIIMMAPVFCTLGFTFASNWYPKPRNDNRAAPKAEKRAEVEKKRAEEEKKLTEAMEMLDTSEKHSDSSGKHSDLTIKELIKNAQSAQKRLVADSVSFDSHIEESLENKKHLLAFVDDIKKEQKQLIEKIDKLRAEVENYCNGLHDRRERVIGMLATYI